MTAPEYTLYGYWRSSASWRVRLVLASKGIAWADQPVHLVQDGGQQHADAHRARNPMRQVPVLAFERDGQTHHLGQSMAIFEYLEARHPDPALVPGDLVQRAYARQMAEVVNSGIQPLQNLAVLQHLKGELSADAKAWARHFIHRGLVALEQLASQHAGTFLVGDSLSIADICMVPQLYNARRFAVDLDGLDTLVRVDAHCATLPAFIQAHPDQQPDAPAAPSA